MTGVRTFHIAAHGATRLSHSRCERRGRLRPKRAGVGREGAVHYAGQANVVSKHGQPALTDAKEYPSGDRERHRPPSASLAKLRLRHSWRSPTARFKQPFASPLCTMVLIGSPLSSRPHAQACHMATRKKSFLNAGGKVRVHGKALAQLDASNPKSHPRCQRNAFIAKLQFDGAAHRFLVAPDLRFGDIQYRAGDTTSSSPRPETPLRPTRWRLT